MSITSPRLGARVSYEDMANPLRVGTVNGRRVTRWGTDWLVTWDAPEPGDHRRSWTDLRQHGWREVDQERPVLCPACHGTGAFGEAQDAFSGVWATIDCGLCDGDGEVAPRTAERWLAAQATL